MSLKHKNTGKWAKGQIRFGKYNKEVSFYFKSYLMVKVIIGDVTPQTPETVKCKWIKAYSLVTCVI